MVEDFRELLRKIKFTVKENFMTVKAAFAETTHLNKENC